MLFNFQTYGHAEYIMHASFFRSFVRSFGGGPGAGQQGDEYVLPTTPGFYLDLRESPERAKEIDRQLAILLLFL